MGEGLEIHRGAPTPRHGRSAWGSRGRPWKSGQEVENSCQNSDKRNRTRRSRQEKQDRAVTSSHWGDNALWMLVGFSAYQSLERMCWQSKGETKGRELTCLRSAFCLGGTWPPWSVRDRYDQSWLQMRRQAQRSSDVSPWSQSLQMLQPGFHVGVDQLRIYRLALLKKKSHTSYIKYFWNIFVS